MTRAEEFEELRPLLFSIAYRLLGAVGEAEDVVQDAWLRYDAADVEVEDPRAYLSRVVSRLALDVLRSARHRHESYVGEWFPEPLPSDPYDDPERAAELADSLSMASLILLERLSPAERAVFVLHEVFGFGFAEIADVVGRSEEACRQLGSRARRHVRDGRPRFEADRQARDVLASRFFSALREGDVDGLRDVLAADAHMVGDSGGNAPRWARPIVGADRVARTLAGVMPWFTRIGGTVEEIELNGQPGAILHDRDGAVLNTFVLDVVEGQVATVRSVLNPDKLRHLGTVADAYAVFAEAAKARRDGE